MYYLYFTRGHSTMYLATPTRIFKFLNGGITKPGKSEV